MQLLRVLMLAPLLWLGMIAADAWQVWHYRVIPPDCAADTAVVMGAAQYDGEPSPALRRRLDRALELYTSGCVERLVVSGGKQQGDRFSEGEAGVLYLAAHGVVAGDLLSEVAATNTLQNLVNSYAIVGDEAILIVTDDLHAHRSEWLAQRLGLAASLVTVPVPQGRVRYGLRELMILTALRFGFVGSWPRAQSPEGYNCRVPYRTTPSGKPSVHPSGASAARRGRGG